LAIFTRALESEVLYISGDALSGRLFEGPLDALVGASTGKPLHRREFDIIWCKVCTK
jgi:hypothetical protein